MNTRVNNRVGISNSALLQMLESFNEDDIRLFLPDSYFTSSSTREEPMQDFTFETTMLGGFLKDTSTDDEGSQIYVTSPLLPSVDLYIDKYHFQVDITRRNLFQEMYSVSHCLCRAWNVEKKIKAMAKPKPDEGYPGFFILQIFDGNPSLTCHLERTPEAVSLFHRR